MKTLLQRSLPAALCFITTACGTTGGTGPQISDETKSRLNASLDRLAVMTITLGEAAAAAQITKLGSKITPSGK